MIKLLTIAALAAAVAAPAFAQTVPPRTGGIGVGPLQNGPVVPGTSSVPGPVFPNMPQKSLDTPSGH